MYFLPIKVLSWFSYACECLIINQWDGIGTIECKNDPTLCFADGDSVIDYFHMKKVFYLLSLNLSL